MFRCAGWILRSAKLCGRRVRALIASCILRVYCLPRCPNGFCPRLMWSLCRICSMRPETQAYESSFSSVFRTSKERQLQTARRSGRLDAISNVVHFRTRLEAERCLLEACKDSSMVPVVFRAGIVYGKGIKLVEGARWMLGHRLMAIWKKPTWAHLIALPDFLAALQCAIEGENVRGVYQVCDDAPLTLQDFLDKLADHYDSTHAWRLPAWMFHAAAISCEAVALILRTPTPLNRDIIRAGMTSCVADNSRMKRELLPTLAYPTITEGIRLL